MSKTQMSARERIANLLDDGSFVEIGSGITSRNTDFNLKASSNPCDGVVTGYGVIDGKLVYVYSQDASVLGGSVGEMHAKKISKMYDLALKVGAPVIGLVDCAGLRLQEAADALAAFGEIYAKQAICSGVILQLTGVFGTCGGGAAMIPGISDVTVMEKENAKLFVSSPNALEGNIASKLDTASAQFQAENTGLVDLVADDEAAVLTTLRQLVNILPATNEDEAVFDECNDDLNRIIPDLEEYAHDARSIFAKISDHEFFMELKADYAKDMVTGFIKLDGMTVGCVGNQVSESEGMFTTKGAKKAADFVNFCDAFSIPVLTLSNVKGYKTTVHEERTIGQAVSKMIYAFANATTPKINVVIGDSFGTSYVAMNSKSIGADIEFAWPNARIGMMDPKEAVKIMYAKEIAQAEEKLALIDEKTAEYEQLQSSVEASARRGYVDDIIEPDATRKRLIASFEMLYTKREERPAKKHGTV